MRFSTRRGSGAGANPEAAARMLADQVEQALGRLQPGAVVVVLVGHRRGLASPLGGLVVRLWMRRLTAT